MIRHHRFTLIELLAAMAVFTVLLLISMRLFSGTQRMWVRSEQKTNAFADTRAAMEFVAARLQTMIYYAIDDEKVPFKLTVEHTGSDSKFDKGSSSIYFMTAMPMNRRKMATSSDTNRGKRQKTSKLDSFDGFRFLRFRVEDGKLKMDIASSHNSRKFPYLAPPYGTYYSSTPDENKIFVAPFWENNDTASTVTIMKNVTSFKLTPYVSENGKLEKENSDLVGPPALLEIEVSVIDNDEKFTEMTGIATEPGDDENVQKAKKAEREAIQSEYGYTFRRAVVLGK